MQPVGTRACADCSATLKAPASLRCRPCANVHRASATEWGVVVSPEARARMSEAARRRAPTPSLEAVAALARRYLAGESIAALARSTGMDRKRLTGYLRAYAASDTHTLRR